MCNTKRALCLLGALIGMPGIAGADDLDGMALRLIELRSQVEELSQELDVIKQEHRSEMTSLAAQKAELEASQNRLETNIQQLRRELDENRLLASEAGVDNDMLSPVLYATMDSLRAHIEQTLPFKVEERLAEVDEIRSQLETGVLPANRAANRLWSFFEDEIRLTRENGIYSQTIELDGRRLLAEVAKIGSVMMFFRTQDNRVGQVERGAQGWIFRTLEDSDGIAAVQSLFDSLQKQIRQGYFELPYAIAAGGAS